MNVLTIYTSLFDKDENVSNDGMSGKVFLDMDNKFGKEFNSIDEALEYFNENSIQIDRIDFNYRSDANGQMFSKFKV